ncbi:hypothetical protein MUK42_03510 [Musa troglodytarum]|uniref:Secreted protein n=1 Tax=Musa troglodytarum TaxID=320322 RepID=A0A9E7K9P7_9LILI|nr:hypothetical protein MUK42_03510 [Musa troglodytarum]
MAGGWMMMFLVCFGNISVDVISQIVKQFLSRVSESYTSRSSFPTATTCTSAVRNCSAAEVGSVVRGPLSSCIRGTAHAATFCPNRFHEYVV